MRAPLTDESLSLDPIIEVDQSSNTERALTVEATLFYADRASKRKSEIDQLAATISQRQDRLCLINDLICDLNHLPNNQKDVDLSQHPQIQEKLQVLKELGANISMDKILERDSLIETLHLTSDSWHKINENERQKIEIFMRELHTIFGMLKNLEGNEKQAKRAAILAMKG